jgi:orotidine-5'-phosphate decarboxylase
VAVALDTDDWNTFREWCDLFAGQVGVLKVGLEAFIRWGPQSVQTAGSKGSKIFLDLKLHDIPNTVAGAVGAARDLGVDYLTIHTSGGPRMLAAACEAAADEISLLGVTVLTHLDPAGLKMLDLPGSSQERVERWSRLAQEAGCAGIVCSPLEVAAVRARRPRPFLLVTPGIRTAALETDDQRRTSTPRAAIDSGADLLVIGRPLTRAPDPLLALREIEDGLSG